MAKIGIRPADLADQEAVLAFCAHTWDWGDYIDRVWDDWLRNPNGQLLVATSDERPIGLVHIRMLSKIDAWIEGLRVDPDYRRQGIAAALDTAAMGEAMRQGATHIRMVTESTNAASIALAKSLHMRQVGAFTPFIAAPITLVTHQRATQVTTQRATTDDLDEIIDYLNASNVFPVVGGLYYSSFTAHVITAEFLEMKIAAQQIYLLRRWERLDGLAILEPRDDGQRGKRLSVGYIDGTTIEAISLIAYDLRHRLPDMGLDNIFVYAPDLVLIRDGLAGIEFFWSGNIFLTYERGLY